MRNKQKIGVCGRTGVLIYNFYIITCIKFRM